MEERFVNIAKELKGKTVLRAETGEKLGEVSDALVHPTEGLITGIEVRNSDGKYSVIERHDFVIGPDAIMSKVDVRFSTDRGHFDLKGGFPALADIQSSNVVTEDGKLLGRISELYLHPDGIHTIYAVSESSLQRFLGRGFYISGNTPTSYSQEGARMIVPADTEDRAASSVNEILNLKQPAVLPE